MTTIRLPERDPTSDELWEVTVYHIQSGNAIATRMYAPERTRAHIKKVAEAAVSRADSFASGDEDDSGAFCARVILVSADSVS